MTSTKFTWISFYKELSDKLLTYRDRRDDLINKLATVYESIGMSLPKLEADELQDIDPFTVFGLFNKGITDANRQKIIAGIAERGRLPIVAGGTGLYVDALVGNLCHWIGGGMKGDPVLLSKQIGIVCNGALANIIARVVQERREQKDKNPS